MDRSISEKPDLDRALTSYVKGSLTRSEAQNRFYDFIVWHLYEDRLADLPPVIKQLCRAGIVEWPAHDDFLVLGWVLEHVIDFYTENGRMPRRLAPERIKQLKSRLKPILDGGSVYRVKRPFEVRVHVRMDAPTTIWYDKIVEEGTILRLSGDVLAGNPVVHCRPFGYIEMEPHFVEEDFKLAYYRGYFLRVELDDLKKKCTRIKV